MGGCVQGTISGDVKIGYVLAYVQGVAADEEADDIFCQRMVESYENAPDEDKESVPLEEYLKEWGINRYCHRCRK